ncbi:type I secretion C-terminal target domain-containing protein, partial [Acinetobacter baumannii]|uniref:type I secretion C-terminal target domain-containing protein n=2 Tax=Acinetobacter baumannii TaxID=470 RepID=UPI0029427343
GITVKVTPAAEGEDTVVTAVVTDPQGNTSPEGKDNSTVDLVVPGDVDGDGEKDLTGAPVVEINDGDDGVINPSDLNADGTVDAKVTFPKDAGYSVGDTVVIKDQDGTELVKRPLTAEDLENGITVKVTPAAEGEDTVVTAVVTDPQGNTSPEGKDNSTVDLVVRSLEITEINEDGVVKGQTTDVPVGSDVVLTFKDHTGSQINDPVTGKPVTVTTVVKPDGSYEAQLPEDLTSLTDQINVKADSFDNNGKPVSDNEDTKKPITEVTTNGNDSLIGTTGDDVLAGDTGGLKTNFVAGHNYNVSIVLDLSGSMLFAMDGTSNPQAGTSRLDMAKKGLKAFIQQMVDHDGVINLQLASFSSTNTGNNAGNQYNKSWVVGKGNLQEIFNYIDALQAGGGTRPDLGWKKAENWFDGSLTGLASGSVKANSSYENQTYFLTDGEPSPKGTGGTALAGTANETQKQSYDADFVGLTEKSKVFAVGVSSAVSSNTVSRYDNTAENGDKILNWSKDNHGDANAIADADKLIAYLIGGSENFIPVDVGNDVVKGGAGDDILFGDAMNTDWITGLDPLQYPKYSGYSKLIAHLKANVTIGAEPTQQQIYDFVKDNYQKFVTADATDTETKGGNDIIYGGSGNDIIIAGAGDDRIYGGSGDDIISTGRGNDTIIYDVLNAADAMGGNGTDTWVDYAANDKIEFGADFFEGLLADKSNISEYIKVEDVNGKAVLKVDRDGAADATGGTTHDWADLLIIEGKTASELQDLINNQIIIG